MTNQEAFDKVVAHLREQWAVSRSVSGSCAYRGLGGLRCAIGALIPDELYRPEMEGYGVATALRISKELKELLDGVDVNLLHKLQVIHDEFPRREWERRLEVVAAEHQLSWKKKED